MSNNLGTCPLCSRKIFQTTDPVSTVALGVPSTPHLTHKSCADKYDDQLMEDWKNGDLIVSTPEDIAPYALPNLDFLDKLPSMPVKEQVAGRRRVRPKKGAEQE